MDDDAAPVAETLTVIRSSERFVSQRDGITTRHAFSFGDHYDPANVSFGPLVALNDELFEPGAGYAEHEHRDIDIVTWVLEGSLLHEDSSGRRETITNGTVQRLTAGSGVRHSEVNAGGPGERLRLVQLWFEAAAAAVEPSYETWTLEGDDAWTGFTSIAGDRAPNRAPNRAPRSNAMMTVAGVTVQVGHLPGGTSGVYGSGAHLPQAWQLFVAAGALDTSEVGRLEKGDSVRWPGRGEQTLRFRSMQDAVVLAVALDEAVTDR